MMQVTSNYNTSRSVKPVQTEGNKNPPKENALEKFLKEIGKNPK